MPQHGGMPAKCVILASILAVGALSLGCPAARTQEPAGPEAAIEGLHEDIALLEEFNRLDLTKEQLTALIPLLEQVQALRAQRDELRLDILTRLQAHLEAMREALLKDETPTMAVRRQAEDLQVELVDFDSNTDQEMLTKFALPLKEVLSDQQVDILTWVSEARAQAVDYLEWARGMSDEEYKTEAGVFADSMSEGREITAAEVLEILQTARSLSAEEYGAGQAMLADKLLPAVRDDEAPVDLILVQRVQSPRLVGLLKAKLAKLG